MALRIDTVNFTSLNGTAAKNPRYVVRVNFGDEAIPDYIYFTDKDDIPNVPVDGTIYHNILENVSSTSQSLDLVTGFNKIGSISFSLIDNLNVVTDLLASKLTSLKGINKKQVRIYYGYETLDFTDFTVIGTQNIDKNVIVDGASYKFNCRDKQRDLETKIFEPVKTTLFQTLDIDTTDFLYVYSITDFEYLDHGSSYSDAPNEKVFYVKIDEEIISITNAVLVTDSELPTFGTYQLTIHERNALRTTKSEHIVDPNDSADARPEVSQMVYLELPAVKMVYAILTGVLYNEAGKVFPSKWSIGLSESDIRISDFTNIGLDLWDPTDDAAGKVLKFIGEDQTAAKAFIESQLLELYALFIPIHNDGNIGLDRAANVLTDAPFSLTLNEDNISKVSTVRYELSEIRNLYQIQWGYDYISEDFARNPVLADTDSITTNEISILKVKKFRGLSTERHTSTDVKYVFDQMRDRWAGPPIYLTVDVLPTNNNIQVGTTVRVNLPEVHDHTGIITSLNRTMEVQRVRVDWLTGKITLDLFGSTQKAAPITFSEGVAVLGSDFYDSALNGGTDISTLSGTSFSGGALHFTSSITITGNDDIDSAIYSYDGNVTIDAGVIITSTKNIQFRISGKFLNINGGTLTSKGQGIPGLVGNAETEAAVIAGDDSLGYFGATTSQGGYSFIRSATPADFTVQGLVVKTPVPVRGSTVTGSVFKIPLLELNATSTDVTGYPNSLMGAPGAGGSGIREELGLEGSGTYSYAIGAAGGASGGGILIIAGEVVLDTGSIIDTSGDDGSTVAPLHNREPYLHPGAGAGGMPGSLVIIIDSDLSPPAVSSDKFIANSGKTQISLSTPYKWEADNIYGLWNHMIDYINPLVQTAQVDIFTAPSIPWEDYNTVESYSNSAYRVQFLNILRLVEGPTTKRSIAPINVSVSELRDTPKTAKGNISTLTVSFTKDAGDNAYWYSNVYYRVAGTTQWYNGGASASSVDIQVPSDGTQYEFEVRSVSKQSIESTGGAYTNFTVSNVDIDVDITVLGVPDVSGLELFEQGNNTEYTGREVKLAWRKSSLLEWYNFGYEPLASGSGAGAEDLYFKDYEVRVYDGTILLRTENVTDNWYNYSHEKNFEDTGGFPVRSLQFEIRQRSRLNQYSANAAKTPANNPAPGLSTGVSFTPLYSAAIFAHTIPNDLDWKSVKIYFGTSTGFTADATSLVHEGPDAQVSLTGIGMVSSTEYFFRYRNVDEFGDGELSSEFSITTLAIPGGDVSLTESLIVAGIESQYHLRLGPEYVVADDATYVQRYTNLTTDLFTLDEVGNAVYYGELSAATGTFAGSLSAASGTFTGSLTAATGTFTGTLSVGVDGYTNITDKPTNLAGINTTEGTKLTGISDNADVTTTIIDGGLVTTGGINLNGSNAYIRAGQTAYNTGTGFWEGKVSGVPKSSIGNGDDIGFVFDGTDLEVLKNTKFKGVDGMNNDTNYRHDYCLSIDGREAATISNMTVNAALGAIQLKTSSTTYAANAEARYASYAYQQGGASWEEDRIFKATFFIGGAMPSDGIFYMGMGSRSSDSSHIRFKMTQYTIVAEMKYGGTTYTSATLHTAAQSDVVDVRFDSDYANNIVKFYTNDVLQATATSSAARPEGTTDAAWYSVSRLIMPTAQAGGLGRQIDLYDIKTIAV